MPTVQTFILERLEALHRDWRQAVADLTPAQIHTHPGGSTNTIAFVLWHYVRTQDNLVQFVFQRKPTIWMAGGWDQRFSLDAKAQGTGFAREAAAALRISDLAGFAQYAAAVFQATEAYVQALTEQEMARVVTVRPLGQLTILGAIGTSILTHGYSHLGELWALRGLQGLPGASL